MLITKQDKNKLLSPINQIIKTLQVTSDNLADLTLIIFGVIIVGLTAMLGVIFAYYLPVVLKIIQPNQLFLYNIISQALTYILFLLIAVIAQILVVNRLLNPQITFKTNIRTIKKYFVNFLCLTIISNIIFVVLAVPIYVGLFLTIFQQTALAIIAILTGVVAIILAASYLIFSPYILVDENERCIAALKKSAALVKNYLGNIILKIIILALGLALLDNLSLRAIHLPLIGKFLSAVLFAFMIIVSFSYLFVTYRDLKNLKNVR